MSFFDYMLIAVLVGLVALVYGANFDDINQWWADWRQRKNPKADMPEADGGA